MYFIAHWVPLVMDFLYRNTFYSIVFDVISVDNSLQDKTGNSSPITLQLLASGTQCFLLKFVFTVCLAWLLLLERARGSRTKKKTGRRRGKTGKRQEASRGGRKVRKRTKGSRRKRTTGTVGK